MRHLTITWKTLTSPDSGTSLTMDVKNNLKSNLLRGSPEVPQTAQAPGKSTLWTNAGQDRNFQRTSSSIGPNQFRGKFVWTNHWSIPVPGEICMDQWSYTGIGPWMALSSFPASCPDLPRSNRTVLKVNPSLWEARHRLMALSQVPLRIFKKREGVREMGTKPLNLKALRGYRASNRGSKNLESRL